MTDVLIVGAGPAGTTTGLLLARQGFNVLILDRSGFPREKACGECIGAGALPLLGRIGLLAPLEALPHGRLEGWAISVEAGPRFCGRFERSTHDQAGYSISMRRRDLDSALLRQARTAGCSVRTGWHVTDLLLGPGGAVVGVTGRDEAGSSASLRARVVVGADGLRSVISRRLGLVRRSPRVRRASLTAHLSGVRATGAFGEMHLGDGLCLGLAPVGDGVWNVTLVGDVARFAAAAGGGREAFFTAGLRDFHSLRDRLREARCDTTGRRPGSGIRLFASGPFDWPVRTPIADGAVLVGDAAGYFDPFTGQGIRHALEGADILAAELAAALSAGRVTRASLRGYARRHRRILNPARRLERGVDAVVWRPRLRAWMLRRLAAAPAAADGIVAASAGLIPIRRLISGKAAATFLSARPPLEVPA